jgi:aspyridone synthetase trans-acting enoyl reductase
MRETAVPCMQSALVIGDNGERRLRSDVLTPMPGDNEVLIRVHAIALNPSDVKILDHFSTEGTMCGSYLAGYVVLVGTNKRKDLQIGDRVSTFVFRDNPTQPSNGAFAKYVVAGPNHASDCLLSSASLKECRWESVWLHGFYLSPRDYD